MTDETRDETRDELTECAYCARDVRQCPAPAATDDEAWEALAREHNKDCEWVTTRGHQRMGA